ncbi:MAG TPA: hypothetical protein VG965_00815 [Patescibacteria group bacterium]|nr:hypothetical protein [Patescibacteria group bacterium]
MSTKQEKNTQIRLLFIACLISAFIGYLLPHKTSNISSPVTDQKTSSTKTINGFSTDYKNPDYSYMMYHIQYPADYYATSPQMISGYLSAGGGGLPSILLLKGHQLTGDPNGTDRIVGMDTDRDSCIYVFQNFAEAIPLFMGQPNGINEENVIKTEEITAGKWKMQFRTIKYGYGGRDGLLSKEFYEGAILVHDSVNYIFRTCNLNNKEDFLSTAASLDVRGPGR